MLNYNQTYHDTLYPAKASRLRWGPLQLFLIILRAVSFLVHLSACCLLIQRRSGVILVKESPANCNQSVIINHKLM